MIRRLGAGGFDRTGDVMLTYTRPSRATTTERRGSLWRSRWAAVGAAVAVSLGAGGLLVADAAGGTPSDTVLTDPVRILDTRDPLNIGLPGPFVSPVAQKLQVTGPVATPDGMQTVVPAGATGVLLNVTAVGPTANGFISVRPGDATGAPSTSSLNVTAGTTVPNAVTVALPTSGPNAGRIDITWDALGTLGPTTDVLVDVVGYTLSPGAATQAYSSSGELQPADHLFGSRTITTTRSGHLQLSFVGRGYITCPTSSLAQAWIEVDGMVVSSSRVTVADVATPQIVLQGVTSSAYPAGDHQVRIRMACLSGELDSTLSSTIHSWIVTVLDGTPAAAALDVPAALVDDAPAGNCTTVDDETICTP
jgi:hypothetical protein